MDKSINHKNNHEDKGMCHQTMAGCHEPFSIRKKINKKLQLFEVFAIAGT
jgi:hypothetical protein